MTMLCDLDPAHGEMQAEPIYHLDGTINTDYPRYYFCQVLGCDGYGGPVEKPKAKTKKATKALELLPLFEPLA